MRFFDRIDNRAAPRWRPPRVRRADEQDEQPVNCAGKGGVSVILKILFILSKSY